MNMKDFSLMGEDENSYHVGHPEGKKMAIPKAGLSEKAHAMIKGLKPQHLDEGGDVQADPQTETQTDSQPAPDNSSENRSPADVEPAEQQENLYNKAFTAEQQANTAQAQAIGQQGQAESAAINKAFSNPTVGPPGYIAGLPSTQDIIAANKAKDDALAQAYASKRIDPNHYFSSGTGNKVAASLGLILGGMGSATTGQPNLAQQNINSAINRDIEAQKDDQSSAMNSWKMNREALGSDVAANLATRQQALVGLQYQLKSAAAQFKGPIAAAQQQALNAHIEQEKDQNRLKLSLLGPTSDAPDPATRVPILVPPERQKDVQEEIKTAQDTASISPQIKQSFEDAAKEVRPMSGGLTGTSMTAFIPGMQSPSQKKFSGLINTTVKEKEGTARAAAFESLNKNMKPEFGDDDSTIAIKRQFMNDYLKANMSAPMAKSYGIDLSKFPSTQVPNTAQKTPPTNSDLTVKWITREGKQLPALINKAGKFVRWQ